MESDRLRFEKVARQHSDLLPLTSPLLTVVGFSNIFIVIVVIVIIVFVIVIAVVIEVLIDWVEIFKQNSRIRVLQFAKGKSS